MSIQDVLGEFFSKVDIKIRSQTDEAVLTQALLDINEAVDFAEMPEDTRSELLKFMAGIQTEIASPSSAERNKFFAAVNAASKALKALESLRWGGLDSDQTKASRKLQAEFDEIYKLRKWGKGRHPTNAVQSFAIRKVYEHLNSVNLKGIRITQYGHFDTHKITLSKSDTLTNPKAKFEATPARLISNLSKGLGVNLSEESIKKIARKRRSAKTRPMG